MHDFKQNCRAICLWLWRSLCASVWTNWYQFHQIYYLLYYFAFSTRNTIMVPTIIGETIIWERRHLFILSLMVPTIIVWNRGRNAFRTPLEYNVHATIDMVRMKIKILYVPLKRTGDVLRTNMRGIITTFCCGYYLLASLKIAWSTFQGSAGYTSMHLNASDFYTWE